MQATPGAYVVVSAPLASLPSHFTLFRFFISDPPPLPAPVPFQRKPARILLERHKTAENSFEYLCCPRRCESIYLNKKKIQFSLWDFSFMVLDLFFYEAKKIEKENYTSRAYF